MESHIKRKSIRWAPHLPSLRAAVHDRVFGVNTAEPATLPKRPRPQTGTRGQPDPSEHTVSGSCSIGDHHSDVPIEEVACGGHSRASDIPSVDSLFESAPSASSTAPSTAPSTLPSTGTASGHHTNTSSISPQTSSLESQDLDNDSCTIETQPTSELIPAIEVIEICQGTFVAVTQEPGNEDKLQWSALSKRIHMAFAKTCRKYPNVSVQFKLAGTSAAHLQPVILFVCPPKTQKQVRKFLKNHKWLSGGECGYKNMILDGNFMRVALDGEGGLEGGLFICADMGDAQTLCGKLGRLEGALSSAGSGARFTIGGVIIVNDTLCCLTTGHVLLGTDTSELVDSDDDKDTSDEENDQHVPAETYHTTTPSRPSPGPEHQKRDEDSVAQSQISQETRIGRILTTSNWKRGVLALNEDWSLIRLDTVCSADEWIVNQFHYPGTEVHGSLKITIDKLARAEDDITEAEVIILAGCTGLQKGRLKTTLVQLYLDNATFQAKEIFTHEPLSKSRKSIDQAC